MLIAHITFEKITGLGGTFEGVFYCDHELDQSVPLVFKAFLQVSNDFVFTQDGKYVYLRPIETISTLNYLEQFYYGVNFLIKDLAYGRGAERHHQSPD